MTTWRRLAASALFVLPLTVATATANADAREAKEVSYHFGIAGSNFTNCTSPPQETTCLGSGVRAVQLATQVGNVETETVFVEVNVFEIHQHANGTFEIGRLVDHGSGAGEVDIDGFHSAQVRASFAMAAGATAHLRFALTGTGATSAYSGNENVSESGCPTGTAHIDYRGAERQALATGTLSIGGVVQQPTTAAGPAFINIERDTGRCTTA